MNISSIQSIGCLSHGAILAYFIIEIMFIISVIFWRLTALKMYFFIRETNVDSEPY